MTNKNLHWRLDQYLYERLPSELLKRGFGQTDTGSLLIPRDELRELIDFLSIGLKLSTMGSPPAELIFSILKDSMLYATNFFGREHRDVARRNLDFHIFYRPEKFLSVEGYREIDTGLPQHSYRGRRPKIIPKDELLQELFGNLTQELIELEDHYLNGKISEFFSERQVSKKLVGREIQAMTLRFQKEIKRNIAQIDALTRTTEKLRAQVAYWQRKKTSFTRGPR